MKRSKLPAWPTSNWEANEVAHGNYQVRVIPSVAGGTYTLTPSLVERGTNAQAGQAVGLGAVQVIDVSYKVFVHLVDQGTGAIVTQDDSVPRRRTYPTTLWRPGEVIADTVVLSLDGVPKGRYLVLVGLYNPENGERLLAYSPQGEQFPGNAVPLTEIVH